MEPTFALFDFDRPRPLEILFIGNSYTYYHEMPLIVAGLAEAAGGPKIEAARHTAPSCSFERHVEQTGAVEAIGRRNWDLVVLQEKSTRPVDDPLLMHQYARKLHAEIDRRGAKAVFYLTWARQHRPAMQDGLNEAYFAIARELHVPVAPVGLAWQSALAADGQLVLHTEDRSHPNPAGSYLAACVFHATLFGSGPEGLPGRIESGGEMLVDIEPGLALRLQRIAWETVVRHFGVEHSNDA